MPTDNQPSDISDPLLECLVSLTRFYQHPFSRDVLRAGLPLVNHRFTPSLFVRAAERAGLKASLVKRQLSQISPLVLPCVLILKNNQACILQKINDDETVDLNFPETSDAISQKSISELEEAYSGYAIFIQPVRRVEETSEKKDTAPDSWFWGTLWKYRRTYAEVMLAAFLVNIFSLASPLFIMNVYDRVVPNNAVVTLWVLSIGIFIIFGFDLGLRILRGYVIDIVGKKADILMASYLFQRILDMRLANKPNSVGGFVNNLREFESVREFFTSNTLTTLIDLPFVILFLIFIWYLGGKIVLVPLIAIPIVLIAAWLIEKPLRRVMKEALYGASQKNAILVESVSGLETIKSLVAEGLIQRRWEHYVSAVANLGLKSRFLSASVINLAYYAQQIVYVGIVIVGVYAIENNQLTLGGLIACSILGGRCLAPLGQLANMLTRYQQAKTALQGLDKIMSLPTEHDSKKRFLHREKIEGNMEFSNVNFSYPEQQGKALDSFSCKIKAGERVGILGRIGSGKSTLQKLLLALYQPQTGIISLDGIDMGQIDPVDLRRNIGHVPQDTLLFSGTVRDNIVMGRPWADDASIIQAAKLAGVDNIVNRHPKGYAMHVGERGETLSGGQRQSIAIARALISNPNILLLDEPSSAMDERSEQELIAKLHHYLQEKTLILITHRASLLTLVNRLIIMENGKVVMDGSKEEVLKHLMTRKKSEEGNQNK